MMKKTLEKLWNECFAEECAVIDTEEEKELTKEAAQFHKAVDALLTKEQRDANEKYIEMLYQMQGCFSKKAFLKGCEFASSFIFEAVTSGEYKNFQ